MDSRVALLIDSENVSDTYIEDIIKEVPKYGKLVIARFYGDINTISKKWSEKAINYAIKPYHQYNIASVKRSWYGYGNLWLSIKYDDKAIHFYCFKWFDFTPLAVKLKKNNSCWIGDENKVTKAFRSACRSLNIQYFDKEDDKDLSLTENKNIVLLLKISLLKMAIIKNAIIKSRRYLVNTYSDFDPRKYGSSISALM